MPLAMNDELVGEAGRHVARVRVSVEQLVKVLNLPESAAIIAVTEGDFWVSTQELRSVDLVVEHEDLAVAELRRPLPAAEPWWKHQKAVQFGGWGQGTRHG